MGGWIRASVPPSRRSCRAAARGTHRPSQHLRPQDAHSSVAAIAAVPTVVGRFEAVRRRRRRRRRRVGGKLLVQVGLPAAVRVVIRVGFAEQAGTREVGAGPVAGGGGGFPGAGGGGGGGGDRGRGLARWGESSGEVARQVAELGEALLDPHLRQVGAACGRKDSHMSGRWDQCSHRCMHVAAFRSKSYARLFYIKAQSSRHHDQDDMMSGDRGEQTSSSAAIAASSASKSGGGLGCRKWSSPPNRRSVHVCVSIGILSVGVEVQVPSFLFGFPT
jgi:hypothetical protein